MLTNLNSNTNYELSSNSDDDGVGLWDMEANPTEFLELFFVMDCTRYHVKRPFIAKSKEFARDYFANLLDRLFFQLTRMNKHFVFHLIQLIEANPIFYN